MTQDQDAPALAIESASITGQPKSANIRATVLLPDAIPPVTATKNILITKNPQMPCLLFTFRSTKSTVNTCPVSNK